MNWTVGAYLRRVGVVCVLGASAALSWAQPYPQKPIRVIVPFAPGGNVDVTARVVGAAMTKVLGQPLVIENRVGAGGKVGAEAAMKSPPDGYTLMMGSNSSLSVAPNIYKDWPYDPLQGVIPVSNLASVPFVLVTRSNLGPRSLQELIALARQKPGGLTMASAGNGTSNHLVGEFFQALTGTQLLHVPYKGAGPALQDVMAGRVDLLFDQVSSSSSFIEQGKLTPLAVSSVQRWPSLATVPTFGESGVSGFVIQNFTGLVAPAGTPPEIVALLSKAAVEALKDESVRKSFASMGVEAVGSSPAAFMQVIRDDLQRWSALIRDKGIKVD